MDYTYNFPAVQGIQANKSYYIAMVPLGVLSRLFQSDDEYVAPEFRAQRRLNEARIPVIANYIVRNRDNYVFSALAASIDGDFSFIPSSKGADTGVLRVALDARFQINDGQHRKAAILEALEMDSTLKDETIPIVLFEDAGLARSQQIFTDLNKHAVKTSNSISELYDSRNPLAVATRTVVERIPFFNEYTDKEKDNLGKFSSSLFTLNTFYQANRRMINNREINEALVEDIVLYWETVVDHVLPWKELIKHDISKRDLRETYIITQGVVIQALGIVGAHYLLVGGINKQQLANLEKINWRRNAKEWQFRTINEKGRILTNSTAVILTAIAIKKMIGTELSEDEKQKEKDFIQSIGK